MTAPRKNDPARMFHQLDLSKPGALDELLSLHRLVFGGHFMEDPPNPAPPAPPAPPPAYKAPESQEELNRIIGERLAREREKYVDYEDLKAKAAAHDKAVADAMSENEKAVAAAREEGEKTATEKANARLIRSEARAVAAELKALNPAIAIAAIDLSDIKVGDNGEPDAAAIKAKLEKLAADEPYLFGEAKQAPPKADPSQGGGGGDDKPSVSRGREMFDARRGAKKTA